MRWIGSLGLAGWLLALAPQLGYAKREQSPTEANKQWRQLLHTAKPPEVRALCEPWLKAADRKLAAEARKCLANVELAGAQVIRLEGNGQGGFIGPGYQGPGVDKALAHLTAGIALAPEDISIHQGRLHVLLASGRANQMPPALEQSAAAYKGADALNAWLAYTPELMDVGALDAGVAFLRVLEKRYPEDHRVLGNLGAFLELSGHKDEAINYLLRAAKLAPGDAFDQWNLGRALDARGDLDGAEASYRRALTLNLDPEHRKSSQCMLGQFLEKKRKRFAEACELEKTSCPRAERTACSRKTGPR